MDASLLDVVVRLVRLVDSPADARILAPLVAREIIYHLLMESQGTRLRHIAVLGGATHRIARAIDLLRKDFKEPLRIESIAQELSMSVSGLYHQFKAVTALSPSQFQKRLRVQEARRLMLGEHLDAASAAPVWDTMMRRTSTGNTKVSLGSRPCVIWNGCTKLPAKVCCKRRSEASK